MEVYEIAYLFLGLATFVAAGTIINYSRKRSAQTPDPDIKKAFRPLYLFAIGLIIFGIGALMTYYELLVQVPWIRVEAFGEIADTYYYLLYYLTIGELFFFVISASMIMQQRLIGIFMIIMLIVAYLLMFNAIITLQTSRVSNIADFFINFGYVLTTIILVGVASLFSYIAVDTKRSTSLALAYAIIFQVFASPGLFNILPLPIIMIIFVGALMGPAMIAFAFLRPDQKISGELLGYGAAFAIPVFIMVSLFTTGYLGNLLITIIAGFGALAIMLTAGSASYAYGRWRETKQTPTALLMTSFASFSIGQFLGILGSIGVLDPILTSYIDLFTSSFALVIFAVFSILAAGYRTSASIPLIIYIPVIMIVTSSYPDPLSTAISNWIFAVIPVMALFAIPVIIFFRVWRRMKQAGTPGRMRPLGFSIGLLLYILIRFPLLLIDILNLDPGYGLIAAPFFIMWLATTGRLDRQ